MKKFTQRFLRDNKGVTAIEYGLIAGLIVVIIGAAVGDVGADDLAIKRSAKRLA
jgi:pilus assembly protein Flp/PilA